MSHRPRCVVVQELEPDEQCERDGLWCVAVGLESGETLRIGPFCCWHQEQVEAALRVLEAADIGLIHGARRPR